MITLSGKTERLLVALLIVLSLFLVLNTPSGFGSAAQAAPSADVYDLSWWTVDGGGAQNAIGGDYTLSGTINQHDDGPASDGVYTLDGGFWVDVFGFKISLPLIQRGP